MLHEARARFRLPRQIEADACGGAIRNVLTARARTLWEHGRVVVPALALTAPLGEALRAALMRGQLQRGLEAAAVSLAAERRGLRNASDRVSRLCLVADDGAERFYRQVERCLMVHGPRILGGLLEADGVTLGKLLYGRDTAVKLILIDHKDAVASVLRALVAET
jgi:hypothetical protein